MPRIVDKETRQATRDRILHQAAAEFARLGFEQANIGDIAEKAGIGKGTVYLYFSSKHDLFIAMLQAIAERQLAATREALHGSGTLHAQIQALFLAFARLATEDADSFNVYMSALYGVNRAFQKEAVGLLRSYIALIGEQLPDVAQGKHGADPETVALLVLSATESFVLSARVLGYSEQRLATMAPHIADLILRGLEPTHS